MASDKKKASKGSKKADKAFDKAQAAIKETASTLVDEVEKTSSALVNEVKELFDSLAEKVAGVASSAAETTATVAEKVAIKDVAQLVGGLLAVVRIGHQAPDLFGSENASIGRLHL